MSAGIGYHLPLHETLENKSNWIPKRIQGGLKSGILASGVSTIARCFSLSSESEFSPFGPLKKKKYQNSTQRTLTGSQCVFSGCHFSLQKRFWSSILTALDRLHMSPARVIWVLILVTQLEFSIEWRSLTVWMPNSVIWDAQFKGQSGVF